MVEMRMADEYITDLVSDARRQARGFAEVEQQAALVVTQAQMQHLFEPFAQADTSTTRQYGGTGLGLAIASRLAGLMGGRMWAESTPRVGSTFHFTVRLRRAPSASEIQPRLDLPRVGDLRVLVVDDNESTRDLLRRMLQEQSIDVVEARDGREALEKIEDTNPSLILLDLMLPRMDGFEVCRRLREKQPALGVLMLTARGDDLHPRFVKCRYLVTMLLAC